MILRAIPLLTIPTLFMELIAACHCNLTKLIKCSLDEIHNYLILRHVVQSLSACCKGLIEARLMISG
jgi:hypothetical protein